MARSTTPATIRPLEARDRAAVRDIACRTAWRNKGAAAMFEDLEIHADYWTSYYTDHRPEDCWVVEMEGSVIGYFLGCADHAHFLRVMKYRIVPWAAIRALWRSATRRYSDPRSRAYVRHMVFKGPGETPDFPYLRYPSHYHCNILRQGYGRGFYTEMALMFCDRLEAKGVTGLHGGMTEPKDAAIWSRFISIFGTDHVETFAEKPTHLFEAVLGDQTPMVNRAWGTSVASFRAYITWLRANHRI